MGRRKGKKGKHAKEGGNPYNEEESQSLEYFQVLTVQLREDLARTKSRLETATQENEALTFTQSQFYSDKQDIVEYLNLKVAEQEQKIIDWELKSKSFDEDKRIVVERCRLEKEEVVATAAAEVDRLTFDIQRLKTEADALATFAREKDEMEIKLKKALSVLEEKGILSDVLRLHTNQLKSQIEFEFTENVHNLEKKIIQDKKMMRAEMLLKVDEAVSNFRKVADKQIEETTRQAIYENMAISSQLKTLSRKTNEFILENDDLKAKIVLLKRQNQMLSENENGLAKRSLGHQKIVKLLFRKLKENEELLEHELSEKADAVETIKTMKETLVPPPPPSDDIVIDAKSLDEIRELQGDFNDLVDKFEEVHSIGKSLKVLLTESSAQDKQENVVDYLQSNLTLIVNKLAQVTNFGNDFSRGSMEGDPKMIESFKEDDYYELPLDSEEIIDLIDQDSQHGSSNDSDFGSTQPGPKNVLPPLPVHSKLPKIHVREPAERDPSLPISEYQQKNESNFKKIIDPLIIQNNEKKSRKTMDSAMQTNTQIIGGPKATLEYLLGEVRPWGGRSEWIKSKTKGLYSIRKPGMFSSN